MILQGVPSNLDFTGIPVDPCKIAKDIVITRSKDIHSRQVTLQVMKHRKHNPDNLQVYRYDCGNKPPK
jgi:hypothetical protein